MVAAPRTELDDLLQREELDKPGVYILIGTHPESGAAHAYIGEAEVIRERLKQHKNKEFWVSAIVFVSKDENLTKAHVRYLENRLLSEAMHVKRFTLEQNQAGGAKLPECEREDMEVFLSRIRQLLPVLGCEILIPAAQPSAKPQMGGTLICRRKGAEARGHRTPDGFVVLKDSTAVLQERESVKKWPWAATLRAQLVADGKLIEFGEFYRFTCDVQFSSPSAAAAVVVGGSANGLVDWKTGDGRTLKELDEAG
ncbi:MAG TPA: GIY-YIG nuclease family protein [Chthoniobacter sp.]